MTLDLHLTLPTGIMNSIRKVCTCISLASVTDMWFNDIHRIFQHSIFGKMGYAPEVFRLGPAFTENNIQGMVENFAWQLYTL